MSSIGQDLAGWLGRLPDGTLLRGAFYGLVGVTVVLVFTDLRESLDGSVDPFAMPALSPVRMDRPQPDDQVRPYLPMTRPAAPDERGAQRRGRPPAESEAEAMQFRLGTHGAAFADGTITRGTADALAEFLTSERARGVTEIVLHSPGGSVDDATAMAKLIREKGLSTRVLPDGYCASSCPLVFAGGKARIADATSWIGVHQVFTLTNAIGTLADGMDEGQRISAEAQVLLHDLGVDLRVWTHAMQTPKENLYLFTPEELIELKLATEVEG